MSCLWRTSSHLKFPLSEVSISTASGERKFSLKSKHSKFILELKKSVIRKESTTRSVRLFLASDKNVSLERATAVNNCTRPSFAICRLHSTRCRTVREVFLLISSHNSNNTHSSSKLDL